MDENILRLIIETGGTGIIILGIVWLAKPIFLKWLDNLAVARRLEAERERTELEQSRKLETALNGVVAELALSRQVNSRFAARFETMPTRQDFDQIGVTMRDWANKHDNEINEIPKKVWEAGSDPLEKLKTDIEKIIEGAKVEIIGAMDPAQLETLCTQLRNALQTLESQKEQSEDNKPEEA